jgi:putative acetyltransferase
MNFRDESLSDHTSFPEPGEADLVDQLRGDGDAVMSLVAIDGRALTEHVMFSRMLAPFRSTSAWTDCH